MSRLNLKYRTPNTYDSASFARIFEEIERVFSSSPRYPAQSSMPTGSYARGDFVPNSAAEELGGRGANMSLPDGFAWLVHRRLLKHDV